MHHDEGRRHAPGVGQTAGWVGRFALPRRCLLCHAWAYQALCGACLNLYADEQAQSSRPRCWGCGLRLAVGLARCSDCERAPAAHGPVRVAVDYAHPWDRVLMQFKFGARPDCAAALALLMAQQLLGPPNGSPHDGATPWPTPTSPAPHQQPPPTLLVPVPLSRQRMAERGYNQAWELARRLAQHLGLAARPDALTRLVHLPGQAEQDRAARLERLNGVFHIGPKGRAWVAGQRVALVDDVLTTGATAAEAARTLMAAGAQSVQVWAFARTPPPEEGPS